MPEPRLEDTDVLIIDGSNTLWRSSYANGGLGFQADHGFQPTGGVYGFFESVMSMLRRMPRDVDVWVAWEGQRSRSTRRAVVPTYKKRKPDEKREKLAQLVGVQASILRGCLAHTRFMQAVSPNWEGDDVMATIAHHAARRGLNAVIYSGDGDMLQCLRDREDIPFSEQAWVAQYKPTTKNDADPWWTAERMRAEIIEPGRWADVKAMAGDSSDCYPGAPGIGQVWAVRLVQEHGSMEGVIAAAEAGKLTESKARAVLADVDALHAYLDIARVRTSVPLELTPGGCNPHELRDVFRRLRFNSLMSPPKINPLAQEPS